MAIRLRTVNSVRVALCAAETDEIPGDVYLDDGDHYALAAKFRRDWHGELNRVEYPEEWAAMDTQKLRDAETELHKWLDSFWISVKDREPEIGEIVFVVMFTAPPAYNVMARGGGNWKHVTHWAPIPPVSRED